MNCYVYQATYAQETNYVLSLHTVLAVIVILLGVGLRIGNPWELTFINDELSTLRRISFDTVGEVIQHTKTDAHPVGLYVFMYYWTMIFGTAQWVVKLPFLLMSFVSMVLFYKISYSWFNRNTALLALTYFATLQYPIWWASIARQYQSGLFCTLLMVYFWTQILIIEQNKKAYWVGFVLAGAAAMYNHYFSLIFAAVLGLLGFIWIKRRMIPRYLIAGTSMVALFIPHWSITRHHLTNAQYDLSNTSGPSWYLTPDSSFLANHFYYIFQYSNICLGLALLLFVGSLLYYNKQVITSHWRERISAAILFATPLLFGYFYSVYRTPIMRESHLLFSFPYLLLFICSFFPERLPNIAKVSFVSLIVLVNVYTLTVSRHHFETMNSHGYQPLVSNTKAFLELHDTSQVTIILGEKPAYLQYYKEKLGADFVHTSSYHSSLPVTKFRKLLTNKDKPFLIIGSLKDLPTKMALDYYPYIVQYEQGVNFEYYILSREAVLEARSLAYISEDEFDFDTTDNSSAWKWKRNNVQIDSATNNYFYQIKRGAEWSFSYNFSLDSLEDTSYFLELSLDIQTDSVPANGVLVIEIVDKADNRLAWFRESVNRQIIEAPQKWQSVYASMRLRHHLNLHKLPKGSTAKLYYWNKDKQAAQLDNIKVQVRNGNSILYKDTNPF